MITSPAAGSKRTPIAMSCSPAASSSTLRRRSIGATSSRSPGASVRSRCNNGGITSTATKSPIARVKRRPLLAGSNTVSWPSARCSWRSPSSSGAIKASARGVRLIPAGPRISSGSPTSSRSAARLRLIADCVMCSRFAARVTLASRSNASSASSRFMLMSESRSSRLPAITPRTLSRCGQARSCAHIDDHRVRIRGPKFTPKNSPIVGSSVPS